MIVSLNNKGLRMWIPYPDSLNPVQQQAAQRLTTYKHLDWPNKYFDRMKRPVSVASSILCATQGIAVVTWAVHAHNYWLLFWLAGAILLMTGISVSLLAIPFMVAEARNGHATTSLEPYPYGYQFTDFNKSTLLSYFLAVNNKQEGWLKECDPYYYSYLVEFLEDFENNIRFELLLRDVAADKKHKLAPEVREELEDLLTASAQRAFAEMDVQRLDDQEIEKGVLEFQAQQALGRATVTDEE